MLFVGIPLPGTGAWTGTLAASILDMDLLFDDFPNTIYPFDFETYFQSPIRCDYTVTNCLTGQVRSPYHDLDPEQCLSLAFSGIHIMSDNILDVMEKYAQTHGLRITDESPRFSVIDFYLWAGAHHDIYGVCADDLRLIDVGKLDTLDLAEDYVSGR